MRLSAAAMGAVLAAGITAGQNLSREYIRLGDRVIAIESYPSNSDPTVVSLSPMTGSGTTQAFTVAHRDDNGAADIAFAELRVLPNGGTAAEGCVAQYDRAIGKLKLLNDAGTGSAGLVTPGSGETAANSRCSLLGSGSHINSSGADLTVTYSLSFLPAFAGSRTVTATVRDEGGASGSLSGAGSWTIPDTVGPTITNVRAEAVGETTASIRWDTGEASDSQVEYGTTAAYGSQTPLDATLRTAHAQNLTDLQPFTTYHYRVRSRDAAGNPATSGDYTFSTSAPPCTISPGGVTVPNAGGSGNITVTCVAGLGWSAAVNGGAAWLTLNPASGSGAGTVTYQAANAGGGPSRTATATIAGQLFTVTQSGPSIVTLTPSAITMNHDASYQFQATINGQALNCGVNWSVTPPIGTITGCGLYTTPHIILPGQTAVTVRATDPAGNGTAQSNVTLIEYAPPGGMGVSPSAGSALAQTFAFSLNDPHGAAAIRRVEFLYHTTEAGTANACYLHFYPNGQYPGDPLTNTVQLAENNGTGWVDQTWYVLGTVDASVENSQCRLNVAGSSASMSGNLLSVNLALGFKPGFTGVKNIYMRSENNTGAQTYWAQVGAWDLTANPAALAPYVALSAPANGATVSGMVAIGGWALDNLTRAENAITSVQVYVDNVFQNYATLNQPSTACNSYPGRPGCPNVGFLYYWNTGIGVSNGVHTIRVVATDYDVPAHTAEASITVTVNNVTSQPVVVTPNGVYLRMAVDGQTLGAQVQQFTAKIGGVPSTAVDWSVVEIPPLWPFHRGTVTAAGVYTPPSQQFVSPGGQVYVKAVRQAYPSDWAQGLVTFMGWLSPWKVTMDAGRTAPFYSSLGNVTYTLSPNLGTITQYGWYTAPMSFVRGTVVTITATKVGNPIQRQVAEVTLW